MKSIKRVLVLSLVALAGGIGLTTTADAAITSDVKEVEVEIKYGRQEVEFEYKVKGYGVKASYKNELTGERLSGRAAQAKVEKLMENVSIKTDSREAIAETIASQISAKPYSKFEFETEFTNRRKIEFKLTAPTPTLPTTPSTVKEFEVEVKYGRDKIEIDYEVKRGYVNAKYRNELTGEYLTGNLAQTKIEALMAGMEFRGATRKDIVTYILNELGTGTNYRKFEFEVKYEDKTKIEFEI